MSIMADWGSLLPELVQGIANCVLFTPTGGVGSYMDMRAVCPSWRSSITKPSPLAAVTDLRFRPRHWVMVDEKSKDREHEDEDDCALLFFHVLSGRFRRLRLPLLRDQVIFGASDGLLVLMEDYNPCLASVLNPLTGDMLHFPKITEDYFIGTTVFTSVSGVSRSTMVLWCGTQETVEFAGPTSDAFTKKEIDTTLMTMVAFQGNIYYAVKNGRVFKLVGPPEQFGRELIARVSPNVDVDEIWEGFFGALSKLVESDGKLLLVRIGKISLKVFKVDVDRRLLEEVKSIGSSRALLLGCERSLSVDAGKLIPPLDEDCIYLSYIEGTTSVRVYNLRDDTMGTISRDHYLDRPFSLVRLLLNYCDSCYEI